MPEAYSCYLSVDGRFAAALSGLLAHLGQSRHSAAACAAVLTRMMFRMTTAVVLIAGP